MILGIFLCLFPFVSSALTDGCVAYYKLDDLTDEVASYDLTNNNGVTFDTGLIGNGADGGTGTTTKDLVTTSSWGINGNVSSFSMWVKSGGDPVGVDGIMGNCNSLSVSSPEINATEFLFFLIICGYFPK